jgi:hypothetical protein
MLHMANSKAKSLIAAHPELLRKIFNKPNRNHEKWRMEICADSDPRFLREDGIKCGFACGDGWFDLLSKLFADIAYLTKFDRSQGLVLAHEISTIKTKLGRLTIWGDFGEEGYEKYLALTSTAMDQSYSICELCGEEGVRMFRRSHFNRGVWIRQHYRTLCASHRLGYRPLKTSADVII